MLFCRLQRVHDLVCGAALVPQFGGQMHQQRLAQADRAAVHKADVVHVGHVGGQLGALVGAGQLVGKENADHDVTGLVCLPEEALEQLRAGLAGHGQVVAGLHPGVELGRGQVHAVPDHRAILKGDVQRNKRDPQLGGLGGQDIGRRVRKDADHIVTSMGIKQQVKAQKLRITTNSIAD